MCQFMNSFTLKCHYRTKISKLISKLIAVWPVAMMTPSSGSITKQPMNIKLRSQEAHGKDQNDGDILIYPPHARLHGSTINYRSIEVPHGIDIKLSKYQSID